METAADDAFDMVTCSCVFGCGASPVGSRISTLFLICTSRGEAQSGFGGYDKRPLCDGAKRGVSGTSALPSPAKIKLTHYPLLATGTLSVMRREDDRTRAFGSDLAAALRFRGVASARRPDRAGGEEGNEVAVVDGAGISRHRLRHPLLRAVPDADRARRGFGAASFKHVAQSAVVSRIVPSNRSTTTRNAIRVPRSQSQSLGCIAQSSSGNMIVKRGLLSWSGPLINFVGVAHRTKGGTATVAIGRNATRPFRRTVGRA